MELVDGAPLSAVCDSLATSAGSATEIDLPRWQQTLGQVRAEARQSEKRLSGEHGLEQKLPCGDAPRSAPLTTLHSPLSTRSYIRHLAELGRQIAEAAHALHEQGIIHRDIKPGNFLVGPDGDRATLMDLGLAQLADDVDGRLTRTRQFVGTLRYASPQQVLAVGKLDRRTDVYSLGATLWELLTLRPLFGASDQMPTPDLMEMIQREEPAGVRAHNPAVPRDLEAIVHKCLEKDAARRYATAGELARDLSRFLGGEQVRARPVGRIERAWKWAKRRPVPAALIAVSVFAAHEPASSSSVTTAAPGRMSSRCTSGSDSDRAGQPRPG